jgi:hypothetical protein
MDKEVVDVYLEILRGALLQIRVMGAQGMAEKCAIEANHVHNVPRFLATGSRGAEEYYWRIERKQYLEEMGLKEHSFYDPLWNKLRRLNGYPEENSRDV